MTRTASCERIANRWSGLFFLDGAGQDKLWFSVPGLKLELIR